MDDRRLGLALGVAAYAAWGMLSPLSKLLLEWFDPLWLNAFRAGGSALVLMAVVGRERMAAAARIMASPPLLFTVLMGGGVTFLLFQLALVHQAATVTTLAFYTAPLWTAILARAFLGERLGHWFLPAAAVMMAGAYVVLFGWGWPGRFSVAGLALATGSGLSWAVYTVLLRRVGPGLRLRPLVLASFLASAAMFVLLALVAEPLPAVATVPMEGWGWMLLLIAVPSLASVLLFNAAVQRAPAAQVNVLVGLELAGTVLFAWLLLRETYGPVRLAGIAIVLAAVTVYLWERGRKVPVAPT